MATATIEPHNYTEIDNAIDALNPEDRGDAAWEPEHRQFYFAIQGDGRIMSFRSMGSDKEHLYALQHNRFPSYAAAEREREYMVRERRSRRATHPV